METSRPPASRPRLLLKRRVLILVGLLSLVSLALALHSTYRLRELTTWLSRTLAQSRILVDAVDRARSAQVHFKKQVQEWKDVLLRGWEPELFEKHHQAFLSEESHVQADAAKLKELLAAIEISSELVDEFLSKHEDLGKKYREALGRYDRERPASAFDVDRSVRGIDREATDRMDALVKDIQSRWDARVEKTREESLAELEKHRRFSEGAYAIVVCGLLTGLFFALITVREATMAG